MEDSDYKTKIRLISNDYAYDKTAIVNRGTTSIVFKGYNSKASQVVACKIVQQSFYKNHQEMVDRELNILQMISKNRHENIMGFYGYQNIPEGMCFLLEYCKKGNLSEFIKHQKISEKSALSMIYQVICGMDHFNSHLGESILMHRDLKPDNIFLTEDLTIKIGDFGLARDSTPLEKTAVQGTPLYAAPQINGKNVHYDASCDVWSVGLIAYEILTGKKLYSEEKGKLEFIKRLRLGVKVELPAGKYHEFWKLFLNSMIAIKPKDRKTFYQLKKMLDENFESIENFISNKCGYFYSQSTKTQSRNISTSKLLSSIHPSSQKIINGSKHGIDSIIQAIEKEQSFNKLNKCQKYLAFWLEMSPIYYYPISLFNRKNELQGVSFAWDNIYKYLLMTLSTAAYISKVRSIESQISQMRIEVNKLLIQKKSICEEYWKVFEDTLSSFHKQYQTELRKHSRILKKYLVPKIQSYESRPKTLEILQANPKIFQFKKQILQGIYQNEDVYLEQYRALINKNPIDLPLHIIKQYCVSHLRQYYKIRLIGYTLRLLPDINCNNRDYLFKKKQEMENHTKEEILLQIKDTYDKYISAKYI